MISFRLLTRPASMQREKGIGGTVKRRWIFSTQKKLRWVRVIRAAAAQFKPEQPFNEPIALGLTFIFKRPQRPTRAFPDAQSHGDLTNLTKALEDCLTGLFYVDDSLIVKKVEQKIYGEADAIEINLAPIGEWNLLFNE